jgi:hypothetical protein
MFQPGRRSSEGQDRLPRFELPGLNAPSGKSGASRLHTPVLAPARRAESLMSKAWPFGGVCAGAIERLRTLTHTLPI